MSEFGFRIDTWNSKSTLNIIPNYSILDIWDAHKAPLSLLGINPIIGNVKPNNTTTTDDNDSRLTCCIKAQLFPGPESYRLTISSSKVTSSLHFCSTVLVVYALVFR